MIRCRRRMRYSLTVRIHLNIDRSMTGNGCLSSTRHREPNQNLLYSSEDEIFYEEEQEEHLDLQIRDNKEQRSVLNLLSLQLTHCWKVNGDAPVRMHSKIEHNIFKSLISYFEEYFSIDQSLCNNFSGSIDHFNQSIRLSQCINWILCREKTKRWRNRQSFTFLK